MSTDGQQLRSAWQRFVATREITRGVLREEVRSAWSRGPGRDVQPDDVTRLPAGLLAARLDRELQLIEAAGAYLSALSMASGTERHAATLADKEGFVLDVIGDPSCVNGALPTPGALLTERAAGANAIGTALAVGGDCELVGEEQFLLCYHPFRSEGSVLRGPDGEIIGAVAFSVAIESSPPRARDVLLCAARGIEAELVRRKLQADINHLLLAGDDVEALDRLRQDVTQLHAAARLGVERAARATARGEDAIVLLRSATELLERFRERSGYWRALASNETSAPHPFALDWKIDRILDLLSTDLAIRGVTIAVAPSAKVMLLADGRLLFRELFHSLRAAFALAKRGDTLSIGFDAKSNAAVIETPTGAAVRVPLSVSALLEQAPKRTEARGVHA